MAKGKKGQETPLMKQYNSIKARYPGALLLFRVGDFYEMFGEDAIHASKVLDIVLTKRANGAASHIELAGFPHHALDNYLPKLVRAGHRVAICDQLEDPKFAKGVVKRGVTELVTPGLAMNDNVLDQRSNNYLASIHLGGDILGIAFLDLSTGEFMVARGTIHYIQKLIQGLKPAELIYSKTHRQAFDQHFKDAVSSYALEDWVFAYEYGYENLTRHFQTSSLKGFGIEEMPEAITAAGAILFYLKETEHREVSHIRSVSRIEEDRHIWLDRFTIRNLELVSSTQEGGIPLIKVLDETATPMGSRMLKRWVVLPLKEKTPIEERLAVVEHFTGASQAIEPLLSGLKQMGDLERLVGKIAVGRINPREMQQLKKALKATSPVKELLMNGATPQLKKLGDQLNPCLYLLERLEKELQEDPPIHSNQGNIIRDGVNEELDEYRQLAYSGKDVLIQIQQREIERTGISSLKISFNKVFGYYLEVTHTHKDKVPQEWIRKQTLTNAERYITEELKVYEDKILSAEEKMISLESRLYQELVLSAMDYIDPVQQNAKVLATLDCLLSFASIALRHGYVKPEIDDKHVLDIKAGRHPVIERQLPPDEPYVPNDVLLDQSTNQIMIITGPNMAGKSALLRQTALIVLMAQMGSFVPADYARVGIIDKIFTRVGASDNLSRGESTFMVEMTETASILNNISDRSLILMDEIGRGTSTYDGISIAWAIVEYLHNHPKCKAKTLFATHYHELNELAKDHPRIVNMNVSVKEVGHKIVFLRKLREGGSEHSFGIHVAQLAGMPNTVVIRAHEIMQHLEKEKVNQKVRGKMKNVPAPSYQMEIFQSDPRFSLIKEKLEQLDINTISPVEALLKLNELKTLLGES